jgi:hypothetical protein
MKSGRQMEIIQPPHFHIFHALLSALNIHILTSIASQSKVIGGGLYFILTFPIGLSLLLIVAHLSHIINLKNSVLFGYERKNFIFILSVFEPLHEAIVIFEKEKYP